MKITIRITQKETSADAATELTRQVAGIVTASLHARDPINLTMDSPLGSVSIVSE